MIEIPSFEDTHPRDFSSLLCELQKELLAEAQLRYGTRDTYVSVRCPKFGDGPRLYYNPNDNEAFAILGECAADYWPAAVQELSHEVIHMLDPALGHTNYLEEGVAEAFSADMAKRYLKNYDKERRPFLPYDEAKRLIEALLLEDPEVLKKLRDLRPFKEVTAEAILKVSPNISHEVALKLTTTCVTR
jgi:hypothetical protein